MGPGKTGTSRFVEYLISIADEHGFSILYPSRHENLKALLKVSLTKAILYFLKSRVCKIAFFVKVYMIRDAEIVLIHPQKLGFFLSKRLINKNDRIKYFVLDSSFFCIRSYNYFHGVGECLRCIGFENKPLAECKTSPVIVPKNVFLDFQKFLFEQKSKIIFYVQSRGYKSLLKYHFGKDISVRMVGLMASDFEVNESISKIKLFNDVVSLNQFKGYLVFHGADSEAKGVQYAAELASSLPEYCFIFPFANKMDDCPPNCLFKACTWDTGLSDLVVNADAVLCLSGWSAPVEGALIKSLLLNGVVIVRETKYGFAEEIPDNCIIRYAKFGDNQTIREVLSDLDALERMRTMSKRWTRSYLDLVDIKAMLDD